MSNAAVQQHLFGASAHDLSVYTGGGEFFGPITIVQPANEQQGIIGEAIVSQHVPELLGAVMLYGGYASEQGYIQRNPAPQHAGFEKLRGEFFAVPAERLVPHAALAVVSGRSIDSLVHSSIADFLSLRGEQVNFAYSILQQAAAIDINVAASQEGVGMLAARSIQQASQILLEHATAIQLVKVAGVPADSMPLAYQH